MKTSTTILTLCLLFLGCSLWAQKSSETLSKTLRFKRQSSTNVLCVANVNGSIEVQGYSGDEVMIEVIKEIRADAEEWLEEGIKDIQPGYMDMQDSLIIYMKGACGTFPQQNGSIAKKKKGWGYCCNECKVPYEFNIDYKIKVPEGTNLFLSTVNDGNIVVDNVKGTLDVNNVNGGIKLTNVEGKTMAYTVNGDVDLDYIKNPNGASSYYTLNGAINANYMKGLSAEISYKSRNGDFYSNLESLVKLPPSLEQETGNKGVVYKIRGKSKLRAHVGGVVLNFETYNGDIFVKEK